MRPVVLAVLVAACAAPSREVVTTILVDTCEAGQAERLKPLATLLAVETWELGTENGKTSFGTDLPGDDTEACPTDIRHRVGVEPDGGLFSAKVAIGAFNRCTNTPICAVIFSVEGAR